MNKKRLLLCAFAAIALLTEARPDSTRTSSFWIAYKLGSAYRNTSGFQRWAFSEGLRDISSTSRNTFIGFDFLYTRNRMVYGINADFELRTIGRTEPYFFSFAFRAGYVLLDKHRFQLRSLGGIGAGYAFVRFENGQPNSLQTISTNYIDPYARATTLIGRMEVIASFSPFDPARKTSLRFQPIIFFNAGVQPVLLHGSWNYGEAEENDSIDGPRFASQKIDMPKFYKANWFASVGLALSIGYNR